MEAKTKKILMISGIVLLLVALYWFVVRKMFSIPPAEDDYVSSAGKNPVKATDMPEVEFPIQSGSYGRQVMYLQAGLNIEKGAGLKLDGKAGTNTIAAINARFPYAKGVISWALFLSYYKAHKSEINEYLKDKSLL